MKIHHLINCSLVLALILSSVLNIQSQHADIYSWSNNTDIPIIASGLGLGIYTLIKEPQGSRLNTEQIRSITRDDVSSWERSATFKWNESADSWSDISQLASYAMPATLMASSKIRKDMDKVGLLFAEVMLLNMGITGVLKVTVRRKRPFVYNEDAPFELKYRRQVFYSFISGHTSSSAASSFLTAKIFSDYYPDSRYKPLVWAGAAILPAITGYLRYEAGKHFLSDVAVGYLTGATLGFLIPELHKSQPLSLPVDVSIGSIGGSAGIKLTLDLSQL